MVPSQAGWIPKYIVDLPVYYQACSEEAIPALDLLKKGGKVRGTFGAQGRTHFDPGVE